MKRVRLVMMLVGGGNGQDFYGDGGGMCGDGCGVSDVDSPGTTGCDSGFCHGVVVVGIMMIVERTIPSRVRTLSFFVTLYPLSKT